MTTPRLIMSLLFVACFGLAAAIERWWVGWDGNRSQESLVEVVLGDGRTLFANHFYLKADAYFHSGFYPSIFEKPLDEGDSAAMAQDAGATEGQRTELPGLDAPRDWIEAFGRNFFPSEHTHLDTGGGHHHDHDHDHDHGAGPESQAGEIREILPWLKISTALDPHQVESYTVAAYWLRRELNKVDEARELLADGLRANPDSYEILFELGRIYDGHLEDPDIARRFWERGLRKWGERESSLQPEQQNRFLLAQIVSHLALLEEREGNFAAALRHMLLWQRTAPNPAAIQKRIDLLQRRIDTAEARKPDADASKQ